MALRIIRERYRHLFRSSGPSILVHQRGDEAPKVAVDKSRKHALQRSAAHVLPVAVSLGVITLNVTGYFIGDQLQGTRDQDDLKLGILQIASKVQELLVISSLAMVITHVLKRELISHDGLPLGLLVSQWSFTSVSYLWSAELWGGVIYGRTKGQRRRQRLMHIALIVASCVIAILTGPATAMLMTPRIMDFPVGGAIFWLNGSSEHLWPTSLNASYYAEANCSTDTERIWAPECPSAGFSSLHNHLSAWWISTGAQFSIDVQDRKIRKEIAVWPRQTEEDDTWAVTAHAASARMQDAMRAIHFDAVSTLGGMRPAAPPFPDNLYLAESKRYDLKTKLPAARVACSFHGQVDPGAGKLLARFAALPELEVFGQMPEFFQRDGELVENPLEGPPGSRKAFQKFEEMDVWQPIWQHMSRRGLAGGNNGSMGSTGSNETLDFDNLFTKTRRVLAVPVPLSQDSASSLGLVLLHHFTEEGGRGPRSVVSPGTYMTACAVDARWVKGKTVISATDGYRFLAHEYHTGIVTNRVRTEIPNVGRGPLGPIPVEKKDDGPPTGIRLSTDWYENFSPVLSTGLGYSLFEADIADEGGARRQSPLEIVLQVDFMQVPEIRLWEIQNIISSAVADSLSRSGLVFNQQPLTLLGIWNNLKGFEWKEDEKLIRTIIRRGPPKESMKEPVELVGGPVGSTRLVMRAWYKGYVMVVDNWFDWMCVVVLLVHIVIVIAHVSWVLWDGETSIAWDSILEMLALAIKSPAPPEGVLDNTCAGVNSFKTMGAVAWVEKTSSRRAGSEPGDEVGKGVTTGAAKSSEQLCLRVQQHPSIEGDATGRSPDSKPKVDELYGLSETRHSSSQPGPNPPEPSAVSPSEGSTKPGEHVDVRIRHLR